MVKNLIWTSYLLSQYDIPYFSAKFNTEEIAESEGISVQMAARDLRYDWFEEIRDKYDYSYIAIAHNKDDNIETFLINLTRGSGIKGLTGIKCKSGKIIRPLLFASRNKIKLYLTENNFNYREDSSNMSTKYTRNLIRHELIPLFERINPGFRNTMIENINRLKETDEIYNQHIALVKESVISKEDGTLTIDLNKLKNKHPLRSILYEIVGDFGFSISQVGDIIHSIDGISGKQFFSATHRIIKDRDVLIMNELTSTVKKEYYIEYDVDSIEVPISLHINKYDRNDNFEITKSERTACFDLDKVQFPLVLRRWKKGDYFMPLGMKNLKKLSDFFIDQKLSLAAKENIWILESNNKIIWIVDQRIDDRFKIRPGTNKILQIESTKKNK